VARLRCWDWTWVSLGNGGVGFTVQDVVGCSDGDAGAHALHSVARHIRQLPVQVIQMTCIH
jgi:hypothetical protein